MVDVFMPTHPPAPGDVVVFHAAHPEDLDLLGEIFGGWDARPDGFWLKVGPHLSYIFGGGVAPLGELRDLALAQLQNLRERQARGEGVIPFTRIREEQGLPSASEFDALFREAVEERVKQHRRNPVTDPARDPTKSLRAPQFVIPAKGWEKET